eukprot:10357-Chlamydomonas_euryale.AAC.1
MLALCEASFACVGLPCLSMQRGKLNLRDWGVGEASVGRAVGQGVCEASVGRVGKGRRGEALLRCEQPVVLGKVAAVNCGGPGGHPPRAPLLECLAAAPPTRPSLRA